MMMKALACSYMKRPSRAALASWPEGTATSRRRQPNVQTPLDYRSFSDKLMGYSPMAPSSPTLDDKSAKVPTAHDITTVGGVWAPTSWKRDKLTELELALEDGQEKLADAATPEQQLDLYLADGLSLIVKAAEQTIDSESSNSSEDALDEIKVWMDEEAVGLPQDLDKSQWDSYLTAVSRKAEKLALTYAPRRSLRFVRDFYEYVPAGNDGLLEGDMTTTEQSFRDSVTIHRLGLLQAAATHLLDSWDALTKVSDADVDRAAVQGVALNPQASTLPLSKLNNVLRAYVGGTCEERATALWAIMDRDDDGLLDHSEMYLVANMVVTTVEISLRALFQNAIQAYPVRSPLVNMNDGEADAATPKMGWRQRRREMRASDRLSKIFNNTIKKHFVDEVEMPHRLRCIYAWADKAHQNNKIDSIHVESTDWGGRRRYVELEPKISLVEFRQVQKEHFRHFDRIGQELIHGFRESLLVDQGIGRQNRELRRDCLLFLTVVYISNISYTSPRIFGQRLHKDFYAFLAAK